MIWYSPGVLLNFGSVKSALTVEQNPPEKRDQCQAITDTGGIRKAFIKE